MVPKGDNMAADLATTWRLLYAALKEWKTEEDKREQEVEGELEPESLKS